jgi:phosphate transport system substrate-binding protein
MRKNIKTTIKKMAVSVLAATMAVGMMTGCGNGGSSAKGKDITVVSREDGSGTRAAFTELMGILDGDNDQTVKTAEITNSTSVMAQSVSGNVAAIGYVSLGSLDKTKVKAVKVDGVEATTDNIKSGSYKVARPFNIATKDGLSDTANDFIKFILSEDGQKIISDEGYISIDASEKYEAANLSGTISVAGSTSVGPVMQVLAEKYMELNKNVTIEVQQTGSSAGMTSAIEGACDIGMASREVKDSEKSQGLKETTIAMDGIAVIVNLDNEIDNLTSDQILKIYTGEIKNWDDVK